MTVNNEAVLRTSIIGIADACVPDADERLARLLADAIDETSAILNGSAVEVSVAPAERILVTASR